jgi:uncharacterized phage protein gp47/JayE
MSNVPHPSISSTGITTPSRSDIIAGLLADFQAAFGGALNPSLATPQGQLIASLAAILGANNDLLMQYVNQVDPALADGRMQDAIGYIYFLTRKGPQPTTVTCICTGLSGTLIPAGSLAQALDGTIYQSAGAVTIGAGGSVSATFQAITTGPVSCPAGSLTTIYRVVTGWDSITNPADGVPGTNTETRAEFEERRAASVAGNGAGILPSILGAVLSVPGVTDAYATENATASSATIGGATVAARSIFVSVVGGTDADVGRAIWTKKPPGCGYAGNTTVTVTDNAAGYSYPQPTYSVTFQRPAALPIYLAVSITNSAAVPADVQTQVRNAVLAAFNGVDGGKRARIGSTIYALRFSAGIQALGAWAQLISVAIGTAASPTGSSVVVTIDRVPTLAAANIAVTLV